MRLIDLPSGAPITKDDIDAALARLGNSGLFTEIRYTVNQDALTIIVKTAPGSQALPVRFANFVWWKPEELEPLVEARVPLFKGKLPLTGDLTDQVEAALVSLLADKGILNAQVSAHLSALGNAGGASDHNINGVVISIDQPQITLHNLDLNGVAPEAATHHDHSPSTRLKSDDFDLLLTSKAIVDTTVDVHRNAGYLDATVKQPFFSEPFKETVGYAVDASATVYPGARYHVAAIRIEGAPPALLDQLTHAIAINAGDPAGAMALRVGQGSAARFFINRGMLDATASVATSTDTTAHTVTYRFDVNPGPLYRFVALDISALSPVQRKVFLLRFAITPGAVADQTVTQAITASLLSAGAGGAIIHEKKNRTTHAVTYIVQPQTHASAQ